MNTLFGFIFGAFVLVMLVIMFWPDRKVEASASYNEFQSRRNTSRVPPQKGATRRRAYRAGRAGWYIDDEWFDDILDLYFLSEYLMDYDDCTDWDASESIPEAIAYDSTPIIEDTAHTDSWNNMPSATESSWDSNSYTPSSFDTSDNTPSYESSYSSGGSYESGGSSYDSGGSSFGD
jgi:uncharacterized membrane protein YgcG